MALYISPARRRLHAERVVAVALVVGLGVGLIAGRLLATTPADAARQVRLDGASLAVNVDRLGIEYEVAHEDEAPEQDRALERTPHPGDRV